MIQYLRDNTVLFFRATALFIGITFFLGVGLSRIGYADPSGQKLQAPTGTADLSGTITYCADTTPPNGAPNVTINAVGMSNQMTSTVDTTGNYLFNDIPTDTYTVTPSKTGAVSGITTTDVTRILQFLSGSPVMDTCQQRAGDVSQNQSLTTADASRILAFLAGDPGAFANNFTGEWRFCRPGFTTSTCTSQDVVNLLADTPNFNFSAFLNGEVTGNWTPAGPTAQLNSPNRTLRSSGAMPRKIPAEQSPSSQATPYRSVVRPAGTAVDVNLPNTSVGSNFNSFCLPVRIDAAVSTMNVTGFRFRFTFNPSVITVSSVIVADTLSANFLVNPVIDNVNGDLAVAAAGAMPLGCTPPGGTPPPSSPPPTGSCPPAQSCATILVNVRFNRVGSAGATTPLMFLAGDGVPAIELTDADENNVPANPINGNITITNTPTAMTLSSLNAYGYDNGVHLSWQTGFEAENLGFNIYREVGGQRTRVTPDLIAGSALMVGGATRLQAGQFYGWWDKGGSEGATYWLEEIDLNGNRTMHGPFGVNRVGGSPPQESQAELLSNLGRGEPRVRQLPLTYDSGGTFGAGVSLSSREVSAAASIPKLASMAAAKVTITDEGWYRVTNQELEAAGVNLGNRRNLRLYVGGVEQAMLVTDDAVEFLATGRDSAVSNAHVYWIVNGNGPGKRVNVLQSEGSEAGASSFPFTIERRDRTVYFSSLRNGDADNFFGQVITSQPAHHTMSIRHIDRGSAERPQVEIALQGVSDLPGDTFDHLVRVQLNGSDIGWIAFDGQSHRVEHFSVDSSLLSDGDNVVTLASGSADRDVSLVDYIRVTYPRAYTSDGDSLRMSVGSTSQTIGGFSNPSIRVFDITDPGGVIELSGKVTQIDGGYAVTVGVQGSRTLLALTNERVRRPNSIVANEPSNLQRKKTKADLLVISRRAFFDQLGPLIELRASQKLKVALVDVEDIYDEFSFGERSPQAVKDFIGYAAASWKKKPSFVLLGGHASLDPNNYLGFGDGDIVPTKLFDSELMETASDDWFVDFNNDGLPELAIGRLPFRSAAEAAIMVSKIISYDNSSAATEALFVADVNDGFDFEASSEAIRETIPNGLISTQINRGEIDATLAKTQLIAAINRGQKVVNYLGHGSIAQWKGNLLTNGDAAGLSNSKLALFVMMTCLNGYFQDTAAESLAEALLKSERGAVAVWASSGMTFPASQEIASREFYRFLLGQRLRLGEAAMRAKAAVDDSDVRRTWILLGDPTMRIK